MSLIAFLFYGWDKWLARTGRWRVPEQFLHLLALAGGWPGAWLAQRWLHHKNRKRSFQWLFWVSVMVNLLLMLGLLALERWLLIAG